MAGFGFGFNGRFISCLFGASNTLTCCGQSGRRVACCSRSFRLTDPFAAETAGLLLFLVFLSCGCRLLLLLLSFCCWSCLLLSSGFCGIVLLDCPCFGLVSFVFLVLVLHDLLLVLVFVLS